MLFEWIGRGAIPVHPLKKPRDGDIRIACAGDSITYGYGVEGWRSNSYPTVLGSLLGSGYCVNNFGVSGSTASDEGDQPYTKERMFRQSLAFCPNTVVLMLGTNDSKPYNWKGQAQYKEDLCRIISAYKALPSAPQILLLAPPPAWGNPVAFDVSADILKDEIRPAVQTLAKDEGVFFRDLYAVFENRSDEFGDGVHPNAIGARLLAETVYQAIIGKGNDCQ